MFLEDFYNTKIGREFNKVSRNCTTYPYMHSYWREELFKKIMRLFVWEGTDNVPPKEIEQRLLIAGHCGITKILPNFSSMKYPNSLTAMFGTFFGVTEYQDEWLYYNVRCPIYAGKRTIGKDIIIISNTDLRNSMLPLVNHYASLLAHTDVTLCNVLINARDSGGVPVVGNEKQKQSMNNYLTRLYNGQFGTVTDIGSMNMINYMGTRRGTEQNIKDMMEVRLALIKAFYSDIGVRSAFEKNNNTVEAEVVSDESLLKFNISDMLQCRKEGAERVNELFGTNWSVEIRKDIDYEQIETEMIDSLQEREVDVNDNGE